MSLAVVIASKGRQAVLEGTLCSLAEQSRLPDLVVLAGTESKDFPGLGHLNSLSIATVVSRPGASAQRNAGVMMVPESFDVVLFLDDDVELGSKYIEELSKVFLDERVVAASGEIVCDGAVEKREIGRPEARSLLDRPRPSVSDYSRRTLYGCNMAARAAAVRQTPFDERLPLYSWLEDRDFAVRLQKLGILIHAGKAALVHLGAQGGRTAGVNLGYSQIVNPLYLHRKGTLGSREVANFWSHALVGNFWGLLRRDVKVDRRGRAAGNLLGLRAVMMRRADPESLPG